MSVPFAVIISNLCVVAIIFTSMWLQGYAVTVVLQWMIAYFIVSTIVFVISANGSLAEMFRIYQIEKTERERIAAHADVLEAWIGMQPPQAPPTLIERTSPLNERYVAPYSEGAQQEALQWIASLYGRDGKPDPKKVNSDGRLKVRMIGSKRGGGSRDAGVWLIRTGLIQRVDGGYALNIKRIPHRSALSHFQ